MRRLARVSGAVRLAAKAIYRVPILHGVFRTTGLTVRGFFRDDCHILAAAISFYAVLSLIPFLLLLFSVVGYVLQYLGQQYANQEDLFLHLETYVRAVIPFLSDDILDRLREISLDRQAYGITGLVILLVTAGLVFRTLEFAFARIFKTRKRSVVISQMLFLVFVLAVGLVFLLVHYLGILSSSFFSARDQDFGVRLDTFLSDHAFLRVIVTVFSAGLVFVVLLKYFARGKTRLLHTMLGGLLFSVLWIVASRAFSFYLTHVARFSLLYGSLATLAIIVVWIFYSACVLLACAEFTQVISRAGEDPVGPQMQRRPETGPGR